MENNHQSQPLKPSEIAKESSVPLPNSQTIEKGLVQVANEFANSNPTEEITGYKLLSEPIGAIPFLVENLLIKQGLSSVVGTSDCGKSTFLRQLAVSVVAKHDYFLDFKINATHNAGIYVSTEDDELSLNYLLNKQNQEFRLEPTELSDLIFIFDSTNLLEKLEEVLQRKGLDFIIIDAFADLFSGNLNQTNDVRCFLESYNILAKKYHCAIIFLHHTGKRTETLEPSKNNVIGSQGYEAKMRLLLELRPDYVDNSKRHLCILKANYIPKHLKDKSYVLNFSENMVFANTGDRVNLGDLAKKKEGSSSKSIDLEDIAKQVFSDNAIGYTDATKKIVEITELSDRTARNYIQSMVEKGLIQDIGKKNKPKYILKTQTDLEFENKDGD